MVRKKLHGSIHGDDFGILDDKMHDRKPMHISTVGGAENIQGIDLQQAEKLYLALPERSNDKHVLLIMYTPTCSHCKSMEEQVG